MRYAVQNRDIQSLVHFTRVENLSNILSNGVIPVNTLKANGQSYFYNDEDRFDNCRDANCLSIQFPNYKMFYKYRCENPNSDWVILGIKKEVLWDKDCAFCVENAASGNVTSIPLHLRKGVDAFNVLYNDYPGKPPRVAIGTPTSFPTNPQAEVLVFDIIEPNYIWGVAFEKYSVLNRYSYLIPPTIETKVVPELFKYRFDYEYW